MRLILFDVDGTLIRSQGAGRAALTATLEEMFGDAGPIDAYRMDGKTDPRIITDLLTATGLAAEEITPQLPRVYQVMADKARAIYPQRDMRICAGVEPLLARLRARTDAVLGLLTGNAAITAPLKLQTAGLDPGQFRLGAYGSDHMDRNQLPAIAMERAARLTGRAFGGENTIIVGDTPADILCARAGEATAVAVASGWHSMDTLAAYHPDHLFPDLTDTDAIVQALLTP
jgi:phosphoglycolate phosphatase-like HAD superfamily hydrolase